ncbi:heat shock protein HslJ [Pedobacter sp. UYEF25]
MKKLLLYGLIICIVSACAQKMTSHKKENRATAAQLQNTKWELSGLPGTALPTDAKATLNFGDSLKISGKSFCNNYGGQAMLLGGKFELKNIFGTKMFCQETALAETAYLKGLNEATAAKIEDGHLVLSNNDEELLTFKKTN